MSPRMYMLACRLLPFVVSLLAGCTSLDGPTKIVWEDAYDAYGWCQPPAVNWVFDSTCVDSKGTEHPGYYDADGECVAGDFYESSWSVKLAWAGSYHESAFAHELLHAWQACRGIHDPFHSMKNEWNVLVPVANRLLEEAGY